MSIEYKVWVLSIERESIIKLYGYYQTSALLYLIELYIRNPLDLIHTLPELYSPYKWKWPTVVHITN